MADNGVPAVRIALQARRVRARARKAHGEIPNTLAKLRDRSQAGIPLASAQPERLMDAFCANDAANSSGQS
jgi:hypothetical protein